jgi:hypothetical protein
MHPGKFLPYNQPLQQVCWSIPRVVAGLHHQPYHRNSEDQGNKCNRHRFDRRPFSAMHKYISFNKFSTIRAKVMSNLFKSFVL